jgi:hypothetical protein
VVAPGMLLSVTAPYSNDADVKPSSIEGPGISRGVVTAETESGARLEFTQAAVNPKITFYPL